MLGRTALAIRHVASTVYQLARKERGVAQRCGLIRMGNSNSSSGPSAGSRAGSVLEHVEHARRTGVCALQGRELSLVRIYTWKVHRIIDL